jgi:DNA-binding response OmpR family regulator
MISIKTLVIEDDPNFFKFVKELLKKSEYTKYILSRAKSLREGSVTLKEHKYDVILLDLMLPNGQGLDVFKKIQKVSNYTPIVILSGYEQLALDAVKEGAQDYIVKNNVNTDILDRSIRYSIERKFIQDRNLKLMKKEKQFQKEVGKVLEEKISVWKIELVARQNKINERIDNIII